MKYAWSSEVNSCQTKVSIIHATPKVMFSFFNFSDFFLQLNNTREELKMCPAQNILNSRTN